MIIVYRYLQHLNFQPSKSNFGLLMCRGGMWRWRMQSCHQRQQQRSGVIVKLLSSQALLVLQEQRPVSEVLQILLELLRWAMTVSCA